MADAAAAVGGRARWIGLGFLLLGILLAVGDQTVTAVVLPSITRDLGVGVADAALSITVFMVVAAAALAPMGHLADRLGRRFVLTLALVAFALSSLVTGTAQDIVWLLGGRAFQGLVFAAMAPATLGLIHGAFPEGCGRTLAISLWATTTASAVAIGPLVGGLFADLASWRDAFFLNVPLCLVAAGGVHRFFAADERGAEGRAFDLPGTLLLAAGVGALVFACQEGPSLGWWRPGATGGPALAGLSPIPWGFLVGAVAFATLWRVERRRVRTARSALLDPGLLAIPSYRVALLAGATMSMALYGLTILLPIWSQFVLGADAIASGLTLSALGVGMMAGGLSAGAVLDRFGRRRVCLVVLVAQAIALPVMAVLVSIADSPYLLVPALLPYGVVYGLGFAGLMSLLLTDVPAPLAALAGGISSTFRLGMDALATAIMVGVLIGVTVGEVGPRLDAAPDLTADERDALETAIHFRAGSGAAHETTQQNVAELAQSPATAPLVAELRGGFADATRAGFLAALVFVLIGLASALRLPRRPRQEETP